jgi:hypothetical protein
VTVKGDVELALPRPRPKAIVAEAAAKRRP